MAVTYLRLFDPTTQFELKDGSLNTAGKLYVYYDGTDDLADIYDEDGTQLAQPAILDNNGRSSGLLVNAARVYRLEVYDRDDSLQFTVRKMAPSGGGTGSALGKNYAVISSDGSIDVDTYDESGTRIFDISIGGEELEYIRTNSYTLTDVDNVNHTCYIVPLHRAEGNMTVDDSGIHLKGGVHYNVSVYIGIEAPSTVVNRFDGLRFHLGGPTAPVAEYTFNDSFAHRATACISCDIHPASDTVFKIYAEGFVNDTELRCNQCTIHSLASNYNTSGEGGSYSPGDGISIVGNVISVDETVIQHKLVAGDGITINNMTHTISADVSDKADKVDSATAGHLAGLDSNGNLTDSGIAATDVATQTDLSNYQPKLTAGSNITIDASTNTISASQPDISGKADKVSGATNGHLAGLDSSGNLTDSGIAASDVATQSDLSGKQDTLVAGSNITINSTTNVISATDTNTHRPIQLEGTQILGDNTDPLNFVAGGNVSITNSNGTLTVAATDTTYSAGNMISISGGSVGVSTTAGITDIRYVNALPANPVATVLYLIPET